MLKSHPGRTSRIGMTLLGAVAWMVLWQQSGPACGQTAPVIGQGEVTSRTDDSVTIDWTAPFGEGGTPEATVFYGQEDKGAKEEGWDGRVDFVKKGKAEGELRAVIEDLESKTSYIYRIRAAYPAEGRENVTPKERARAAWSETATFSTEAWNLPWYLFLVIVLAVLVGPFVVGGHLAKRFRMPDYGWKIGLILCSLLCGLVIIGFRWPPKLGIDLSGGTILVYEVDQQKKDPNRPVNMDDLVKAVSERVNPGGQKEMTFREYGAEQIEIIIPRIDPEEAERVEKIISRVGTLEFRILANIRDHKLLIERARRENTNVLRDPLDPRKVEAWWVPVQAGKEKDFESYLYGTDNEGRRIRIPESQREVAIREVVPRGKRTLEVLVVKDIFDVDGRYLTDARASRDENGNPRVSFEFDSDGARLFGRLTSLNLPDEVDEFYRKLGIVLDGRLNSAPRIKSTIYGQGVIEGSFTDEEVEDLVRVLNAGSLPTALAEEPISRLVTGPTLGQDSIIKGCWAVGGSAVLVLLFMLAYYRFAGVVACAALLMNLVLIVAIMITVGAAFTLPGLAGLVLTVGMAVDANVLIYERMREELARGAALRMAIRNGFDRAMSAIVDSNVTTVITGVVLWVIGTDVIKSFAITLILGVLLSMYTAIFCSRVVFEVSERRRWITGLKMMQILGATEIDFLGKWRLFVGASVVVIVAGLAGVVARSVGLLDIDFTGGVSVVTVFDKEQRIGDIRGAFSGLPDLAVSDVQLEGQPRGTWFWINTSQPGVNREQLAQWAVQSVQRQLDEVFGAESATEKRSKALEAFRAQVVRTLETKPDSPQRESALGALHQQVADLLADAPKSPKLESSLNTTRRDINRLVRVGTPIEYVQEYLRQQFPGKLASNSLGVDGVAGIELAGEQAARTAPEGASQPAATDQTRGDLPGDDVLALAAEAGVEGSADAPAAEPPPKATGDETTAKPPQKSGEPADEAEKPDKKPQQSGAKPVEPAVQPEKPVEQPAEAAKPAADEFAGGTQARLTFTRQVGHDTVFDLFVMEFGSSNAVPPVELTPLEALKAGDPPKPDPAFVMGDSKPYKMWNVKIKLPPQEARPRLESIKAAVADMPFFPSSNTIGGKVAGSTRMQAMYALAASLLFIVAYLWIRFQKVSYGLAAVVAVIHDVLVVLGAIALSTFLAPYLGFLLIDSFKIGLTVVAAFLTIIGYSLNDTIVIFDRVREIRGKSPRLTSEMVNTAVNQTLSRTLLTNLTVAIVVVVLYVLGGDEIHTFAFAMAVGMVAGTYSTVFIASPFLLWIIRQPKAS